MLIFSPAPALFSCIKSGLLIKINIGIATAGSMHAWNAWENIISAGGRCSINTVPKANIKATIMRILDCVEWMFLGVPW